MTTIFSDEKFDDNECLNSFQGLEDYVHEHFSDLVFDDLGLVGPHACLLDLNEKLIDRLDDFRFL